MLARIHLVKHRKEEALDALNRSKREPNLTPYQQMNILAYKCEAAFCKEPVDSTLFMNSYTKLQKMIKETGRTSEFFISQDINYAELTGQYDKMLELEAARAENEAQMLRLKNQQLTFVGIALGILALTVFLFIFMRSRHRAAMRLAEVKAEQERIQSELRIARDIQMSMVPGVFPEIEGLDMAACICVSTSVRTDI